MNHIIIIIILSALLHQCHFKKKHLDIEIKMPKNINDFS